MWTMESYNLYIYFVNFYNFCLVLVLLVLIVMKVAIVKVNWLDVTYSLFKQTLEKLFQMNNVWTRAMLVL
jgi:hypothetical protein